MSLASSVSKTLLGSLVKSLDSVLDQMGWILAHIALIESRNVLLIPSTPKATQTTACYSIICSTNPPSGFVLAAEMQVFRSWFSFYREESATFLCKSFRKVSSNKNLGFSSPGVGFDLECPFYCSSFPVFDIGMLHICGNFNRHVLYSDRRVCASGLKTPV